MIARRKEVPSSSATGGGTATSATGSTCEAARLALSNRPGTGTGTSSRPDLRISGSRKEEPSAIPQVEEQFINLQENTLPMFLTRDKQKCSTNLRNLHRFLSLSTIRMSIASRVLWQSCPNKELDQSATAPSSHSKASNLPR